MAQGNVLAGRTILRVSKAEVQQYRYKQYIEKVRRSSRTTAEVMSCRIRLQFKFLSLLSGEAELIEAKRI